MVRCYLIWVVCFIYGTLYAYAYLTVARFGLPAWLTSLAERVEDEEEGKLALEAALREEAEPYDGETLHAALCARRTAGLVVPVECGGSFGLFAPE